MAIINPLTQIQKSGLSSDMAYKAVVIDNNDPKQLGRIKVKIPKIMDFGSDNPWCRPRFNQADGATNLSGSISVPKVNAFVDIIFESKSIYNPVYVGYSIDETTQLESSLCNYPNRHVLFWNNGARAILDTSDDTLRLYNPGETYIKSKAKLVIKSEANFIILSDTEIGLRAPVIGIRAKKHLVLESEDKLTIRSRGAMKIETRKTLDITARQEYTMTSYENNINVKARGDISGKESSVNIEATGKANTGGNSDVNILAKGTANKKGNSNIRIEAQGTGNKNGNSDITILAQGLGNDKGDSNITIQSQGVSSGGKSNVSVLAAKDGKDVADLTLNASNNVTINADDDTVTITASKLITISAPTVSISV